MQNRKSYSHPHRSIYRSDQKGSAMRDVDHYEYRNTYVCCFECFYKYAWRILMKTDERSMRRVGVQEAAHQFSQQQMHNSVCTCVCVYVRAFVNKVTTKREQSGWYTHMLWMCLVICFCCWIVGIGTCSVFANLVVFLPRSPPAILWCE